MKVMRKMPTIRNLMIDLSDSITPRQPKVSIMSVLAKGTPPCPIAWPAEAMPMASPAMMTGLILAVARAAGQRVLGRAEERGRGISAVGHHHQRRLGVRLALRRGGLG